MSDNWEDYPDCVHYGVECEQPCYCRGACCVGSDEDIPNSGEDPDMSESSAGTTKAYREWISGTSHPL